MKVVADVDGVKTYMGLQGEDLITGTVQDCTPLMEHCVAQQASGNVGTSEMKLAARLPEAEVVKYMNLAGITFDEFMVNPIHARRMLSDPDLRKFRVWEGKV